MATKPLIELGRVDKIEMQGINWSPYKTKLFDGKYYQPKYTKKHYMKGYTEVEGILLG
jgi:hypothetical protein